ncbi:ribulose-phosphate 3-epimerase [Candidatus Carsonella ruddii HC isolate Thao2000]|uniref:Ribulose-phosphate 3-epimerase n=2 Tax=Carsonella ruddii TaxID=114186 RepID=J3TE90_CARRU|nr:ribulose-phosphate 3-epimerase [Candidatus Carsonella ruddii HC isolate Thao2000]
MDFSYVKNISFNYYEIIKILFFLKKINFLIEIHIMSKFFKNYKNNINHFENNILKKNIFSIGNNFCHNYIFYFKKKKKLIMSVIPGFSNQKFLFKTKFIFNKDSNIDGGIKKKIFFLIKNYFNKIIIGSDLISIKKKITYFYYNYNKNNYLI